ncbi:MAG: hypothetical protein ACXAEF_14085, partial [Candidatus Thorarchaeota archaeon]
MTGIFTSVASPNYEVALNVQSAYKVSNLWYHHPVWKFWSAEPVLKRDWGDVTWTDALEITKYHYDVFPSNLDDFLDWSAITLNDYDGDGISDDDEVMYGTSPADYDSDGDGLNDNYEISQGLDPLMPDSDSDTLSDWYEHVYETNGTDVDTDADGLTDFQEISGWLISFHYLGNSSLPFKIPVTSDPSDNDTDNDGHSDFQEYNFNTNPRSNDSNGDRQPDFEYAQSISQAVYHASFDWTQTGYTYPTPWQLWNCEIAVDMDGYLYAIGYLGGSTSNYTIRKYDASLQQVQFPVESEFHNFTVTLGPDTGVYDIEIDHKNEWLYVSEYRVENRAMCRYNMNGTSKQSMPGAGSDIVIDSNGNYYRLHINQYHIAAYDEDGSVLWYRGSPSGARDAVDHPFEFALDEERGFFYMVETDYSNWGPRVVRQRFSDGGFVGEVVSNDTFDYIRDVAVDDDGYVYVLAQDVNGSQVRRYSPTGEEDVGFRLYGNGTHDFMDSAMNSSLCIGPDKSIYISEQTVSGDPATFRFWKFNQSQALLSDIVGTEVDWDNDTLTNAQELIGWDITVNYPTGEETFRVTSSHLMNDTDMDGLVDSLEFTLGSNPRSMDTDMDGVSDHEEWWLDTYPGTPYLPPSQQGSILSPSMQPMPPYAMMLAGTGPSLTDWDTDKDSLGDGTELTYGSSPSNPDSDGDTLGDALEFVLNSNPNSVDTDGDNATDPEEYAGNSSLLVIDSDGDFMLDGAEYDAGSNATNPDHDGDSLLDGNERLFGTDFLSADSDGDGISDSTEFALWLNPLSNDTDGDGVSDLVELEMGSNPFLADTDGDGVPDNMDPDTYDVIEGPLVIAYDPSVATTSAHFIGNMSNYINVEVVSVSELLSDYQDAPYILLIGQPDSGSTTASGVIYNLLEDSGDILDDMMEEDAREIAIRYGIWNENQTVIMMSSVLVEDIYLVLQVLKGREVTILPDSYTMTFSTPPVIYTTEVVYQFEVFGIDPFKATDSFVEISMTSPSAPTLSVTRYNATTTPYTLDSTTGLEDGDYAMGRYLDVELSGSDYILEAATIWIYYRHSDLDINQDGVVDTINDLNESTLMLYYYNIITEEWIKLT